MKTSHCESETGHTAAILEEIPAMVCDGLRCLLKLKIAGKMLISSQRVAGLYGWSDLRPGACLQPSIGGQREGKDGVVS